MEANWAAFRRRALALPPLLSLFLATVAALLAGLIWFGTQWSRQQVELVGQRLAKEREIVADLAVSSLAQVLAQAEEQGDAGSLRLPEDSVSISYRSGGWEARPSTRLAYLPIVNADAAMPVFRPADAAEWSNQAEQCLNLLRPLLMDPNPAVRGGALLRQARLFRKAENWTGALQVYQELAVLRGVRVEGLPAEGIAWQSRRVILDRLGRTQEAGAEAEALALGLADGRWQLDEATFGFYLEEIERGGGGKGAARVAPQRLRLSAALKAAWPHREEGSRRTIVHSGGVAYLFVALKNAAQPAFLLLGPQWFEQNWRKPLEASLQARGIGLGLTAPNGVAALAAANPGSSEASTRFAFATGLPWNVQAFTMNPQAEWESAQLQSRVIWIGLLIAALLVVSVSAVVLRAVTREISISRLQSDFVTAVSHEFRTPLTSICQVSEMLSTGRVSDEADRVLYHDILTRESKRLRRMVEGLLDFGRMEAGAREYRFERMDVGGLLSEVAEEFSRESAATARRLRLEGAPRAWVRVDRAALSSAIWNLLENAMKYSSEESPVFLGAHCLGGRVAVTVQDQGPGIAPAEQEKIFEKFVRGAAAREAGIRGSGIGLALARRIVEAHNGVLRLESKAGSGSTFIIEIQGECDAES